MKNFVVEVESCIYGGYVVVSLDIRGIEHENRNGEIYVNGEFILTLNYAAKIVGKEEVGKTVIEMMARAERAQRKIDSSVIV
jgi:hypothetical protein